MCKKNCFADYIKTIYDFTELEQAGMDIKDKKGDLAIKVAMCKCLPERYKRILINHCK